MIQRGMLIITGAFSLDGGIASVNRLVIDTLASQGVDITVFALAEVDVMGVPYADIKYKGFGGNRIAFTLAIWQHFFRFHPDFIFVDHINVSILLAPLRLFGCKYTVWAHGTEVFPPRPNFEGKIGLWMASQCLTSSEYTRQAIVGQLPSLEEKVRTCHLALDPLRHASSVGETQQIEMTSVNGEKYVLGQQFILHVGRMAADKHRDKGQMALLKALNFVWERHPNVQLVLAGQGPEYERLYQLAQDLLSPHQVFMPGYVNDLLLSNLYKQCYLFAMPSTGEGFGLAYLEAMSYGCACLGGRVDATPEIVAHEKTGILVDDVSDASGIADAICWALEHENSIHFMSSSASALVQSNYLAHHFAERFWKAIER